ncbi:MAG: DNA primase [Vulcanimicrobiaceae bacterium]
MRIDEATIREIVARTDIGALIGSYVPLRKRGNDLVGLCPFHGEKTPSFHVHPDRGFFKCFGCGVGGSSITFFQKIENVAFPDAVRALAKRAGIEVEPETPAAARVRSEKESIFAANQIAADFFARSLAGADGEPARRYCAERGVEPATIERFHLGFAPARWDGLVAELQREGIELELAAKAGLVKLGQRGYYDFYRGRLMIPTYATTGEVVAFGGRSLDGAEPKYLNTSTTPVYTKGRGLFALNVARRAAAGTEALIVVEGYLDCIALHQAGFSNAVAALGTAFTPDQAAELRKYTENVYVCFDADSAGSSATAKSIDVLQAAGCSARIVALPPGDDPDSFIRTHGSKEFQNLLDASFIWVQYKVDREVDRIRLGFVRETDVARRAEQFLQTLPSIDADKWRVYMAGRLGVGVESLRNSRFFADRTNFAPRGAGAERIGSRYLAPAAEPPGVERDVVSTLLEEPALVAEYADRIPARRFRNERLRAVYERLAAHRANLREPSDVLALFADEPSTMELLVRLAGSERSTAVRFAGSTERRAHLDRIAARFVETDDLQRKKALDARIDAGEPIDQAERDEYRRLVERLEQARRKRLGTQASADRKEVSPKPHGT